MADEEKEGTTFEEVEAQHHENISVRLARLDEKLKSVKIETHVIKTTLDKYVTKIEFWPVKIIVFGIVGLILSGVGAAIIALVIGRHP